MYLTPKCWWYHLETYEILSFIYVVLYIVL